MSTVPIFPYSDLFTPAASGVGSANPLSPDAGTWMATLLYVAQREQLPTTSWQSGGPELSILQSMAIKFSEVDANIAIMNQGGLLDFAASGFVTYVAANGDTITQPVTPDPSIPSQNPTGALGWLDQLGHCVYDVDRLAASYATNALAIVNTSGSPIGPFAAGTYHVANPATAASYSNRDALTIASSSIAGSGGVVTGAAGTSLVTVTTSAAHGLSSGQIVYLTGLLGITLSAAFASIVVTGSTTFQLVNVTGSGTWTSGGTVYLCTSATFVADAIGPAGTSAPGTINETITQNTGVLCFNVLPFVGDAWESNTAYANRCRLSLAAKSPNGPANAYVYFALSAAAILASQTPPVTLDGGAITKASSQANPQTGVEIVIVANDNPASVTLGQPVVEGVTNLLVTNAINNAGAIQLVVTSTAALHTNDWATVSGVIGTTEANGTWQITVDDGTHLTLQASTFTNAYVGGGAIEGGDLGQVDNLLRNECVPDDTTLVTQSATAFPLTIAATVVVPAGQATNYAAAVQALMTAYVKSVPIGGTIIPPASTGVVSVSAVEGVLFAAGIVGGQPSYVQSVTSLTVNASTTDVPFPATTANALLSTFNLSLTKV